MPSRRMLCPLVLALAATSALTQGSLAQPQGEIGEYSDATIEGTVLEPGPITVSDDQELASLITVPERLKVTIAGRDLGNTRMHDRPGRDRRLEAMAADR